MKVRILKKHFRISTDVFDYNSAMLTFDDGYKNQHEVAGRIFNRGANSIYYLFFRAYDRSYKYVCRIGY